MPDIDKLIAAMEWCECHECDGCPYDTHDDNPCRNHEDALVMLKEYRRILEQQRKDE